MNRRMLFIPVALSLAFVPACLRAQQAADEALPAPKVTALSAAAVPFDLFRGTRVIAPAKVNGREVEAILDTGASATTLDREYARSIGLPAGRKVEGRGAGGAAEAEIVPGVTLEIGGARFEGVTVGVMDLQPVARQIGRPLPIIIGRELFDNAAIAIDWDRQRLHISPSASFTPPAGATILPLERRGPFNFVKVSAAGLPPIDALLDLGNGSALILPSDYWQKQPALARLRFADSQTGGVGGLHAARAVTLPTVTFGGRSFAKVPATLGPDSHGGEAAHGPNVGIGLLKQFDVVLDLGHDRIFLTPRKAIAAFDRDRSGLRTQLAGDRLKVAFVSAQGPAAAAGLKPGDEIIAVNGRPVTRSFYMGPLAQWASGQSGSAVRLTKADGKTVEFTLREYF